MKNLVSATALTLAAALAAPAAQAQQPPPAYGAPLGVDQAQKIVTAAVAEAKRQNFRMAFTVMEPTGALILFHKMDDTQYGSIRISQEKALTAAQMRRPTKALSESVAASPGIATLGVAAVEGGVPIFAGGRVVGALGVSGGTSAQDGQVAQVALAAAGFSAP